MLLFSWAYFIYPRLCHLISLLVTFLCSSTIIPFLFMNITSLLMVHFTEQCNRRRMDMYRGKTNKSRVKFKKNLTDMIKNSLLIYITAVMNPVLLCTNLLPNVTTQKNLDRLSSTGLYTTFHTTTTRITISLTLNMVK